MKSYIIVILALLCLCGCEALSGSCISGTFGKGDVSGGLQYCFGSAEKSKDLGLELPVIEERDKETGETKDLFPFDLEEIEKILDKIRGKEEDTPEAAAPEASTLDTKKPLPAGEHPAKTLKRLLE